jgi:hypothetical protein
MDFESLKTAAYSNQVRVDNHNNHSESPPYYFDSLRHGLGYYFNTFISKNIWYDHYSIGLSTHDQQALSTFSRDMLDEDNTVLSIVSLQRFFEILVKQFLSDEDPTLIEKNGRSIGLTEALNTFYRLQASSKLPKIADKYQVLCMPESKVVLQYLSWWRNRILHNGNCLPSLWLLDYMFTQLFIPLISDIISHQRSMLGDSLFYLKTLTGIDILKEFEDIKFTFESLSDPAQKKETFNNLMLIGQLKELGRANLNMNLFVRAGHASYEYNYRDVEGRGTRFAESETRHPHFSAILKCPCCDIESLVLYEEIVDNPFSKKEDKIKIQWVKCYTCDYHLRYNVGDLSYFGFPTQRFFHFGS